MPVPPRPFKVACTNCSYSKVIKPKSDALMGFSLDCPKCKRKMKIEKLPCTSKLASFLRQIL